MESEIEKFIDDSVKKNDVILFMKGTTDFPQCGFSATVVSILKKFNVEFLDINVLESDELRNGIKTYSDWPTIPQLYIKGEFIGGCDIVKELYSSGEFEQVLQDKKISHSK